MGAQVLGAPRQHQRSFAVAVVGDDDAYRRTFEAALGERRERAAGEVLGQARAQRSVEGDRLHAGAAALAREEDSATPHRISAIPAKWNQCGTSSRNSTAISTPSAGIRCIV